MIEVRVSSSIGRMADEFAEKPKQLLTGLAAAVRDTGHEGNLLAKDFARQSAGRHGKLYPRSFQETSRRSSGFGASSFSVEYGPDASLPQGGMEFEFGSRNQKPHLDLARSADHAQHWLAGRVSKVLDEVLL